MAGVGGRVTAGVDEERQARKVLVRIGRSGMAGTERAEGRGRSGAEC